MLRRTLLSLACGAAAISLMTFGADAQGLPPLAREGHLQGRLRPDREQQSLAPRPDREHEGRGRQARLAARLHRRRRLGRQAGGRRQLDDRPEGRRHPARPARGEAADPGRDGRQEGRHPACSCSTATSTRRWPRPARTTSPSSAPTSSRKASSAAEWLIKAVNGKAKIIELAGHDRLARRPMTARRASPTTSRTIRAWRSSPASPATSPATRAARSPRRCCQAHPDATAIYCPQRRDGDGRHRGARSGRQGARQGRASSSRSTAPRTRLRRIVDGKMGATVECNPKFGPKAFDAVERYGKGETIAAVGGQRRPRSSTSGQRRGDYLPERAY